MLSETAYVLCICPGVLCVYPVCHRELELAYMVYFHMCSACQLFSSILSMRLNLGVDLSQLFLTWSLCCESCKVEVTHVNIYLITTHELYRALSSLWGRHDLHYNDTVDIFPVTLIVTSLLPVGICGLIRQLVQAIWSCDETRQEERGWDLRGKKRERGKKGGFMEYQSILKIYEYELI